MIKKLATTNVSATSNASARKVRLSWSLLEESIQLAPSSKFSIQFIRSLVVSVLAVVVNFAGSLLFKQELHVNYLVATTISFYLGVLVNYYLSVKWVFATRKLTSKHAEFVIFVIITSVGWLFNELILAGLVSGLKTSFWLALIVATIVVFFWNFIIRKKLLY